MDFPNFFADANASYKDAKYVIVGIPYGKTSSFREGSGLAPGQIRESSWNFETFNFKTGIDFIDIPVHDFGDIDVENLKPYEMKEKVRKTISKIVNDDKFPVVIGGEHSITTGVIEAINPAVSVLSLDAHLDFRDEYEDEALNHACTIKRISDKIKIEDIVVFGVRSIEKNEYEEAKKKNLFYIDSFEINKIGVKKSIEKVKKRLVGKKIYLTFDIDVLDPAFAPGTSTPEPFGLNSFDIIEIIDSFASQFIGFDVVEVCPHYDHGETAILAARYIRYIIEKHWKSL